MFQTPADQRESHVFSTAGRSKGLPANSVPAGPQRGQHHQCVHMSLACVYWCFCLCICRSMALCVMIMRVLELDLNYNLI